MGFSDAELLRYSEEHVRYELWMLVETARPLIDDGHYSYDVVTENARTTEAAALLGKRRYEEAGELMNQSHESLRIDYEVSIPQLDFLAAEALKIRGVYGARMTGGGFGGCIVALAQQRSVDAVREQLTREYQSKYNLKPDVYVTTATAGASVLE